MSSIWNTALNILARREHSQHELRHKLQKRFPEELDSIEEVLTRLVDQHLQSDDRFAEMWLRAQISKGRGPIRILMEARQKGVSQKVEQLIQSTEHDWFEQCLDVAKRKFSGPISYEQKAKAYRFLAYRGFSTDAIQYAIGTLSD